MLPVGAYADLYAAKELPALIQIHRLELKAAEKTLDLLTPTPSGYALYELSAFLKSFLNGHPSELSSWKKRKDDLLKSISNLPEADLRKLYFKSEAYMHQGWLELRSGNETKAAYYFREAYVVLKWLRKLHPNFIPALKNMSIIEAAASHLPSAYKKLLSVAGIEQSYEDKLLKLEKWTSGALTGENYWLGKECTYIMAFTYHHLRENNKAWKIASNSTLDYAQNPLALYVRSLIAYRQGKSQLTKSLLSNYSAKGDKQIIPFLFYMRGLTKLQTLDLNSESDFRLFLQHNPGIIYKKASFLKLAWLSLLQNDRKNYESWMEKIKSNDESLTEEDRQAEREALRNEIPDTTLLKARLLFDGGYFKEALNIIRPCKASDFHTPLKQTEYCYRKARIYDEIGETEIAVAFYTAAISTGKNLNAYYAAYSCLYLGEVYYKQGKYAEAEKYYKKSVSFKANREYIRSIEFRSSEGLRKLPG